MILIFIFLSHFLDELAKVFPASVQYVQYLGIQDLTCFLGQTRTLLFVNFVNFIQNACGQLKHKQALKYARKMYAAT